MRLGTNIHNFLRCGCTVTEALERVRHHGLRYVDFPGWNKFTPQYFPVSEQLKWGKKMEQLDMELVSAYYLPTNNLGSKYKDVRKAGIDELKPQAELIKNLGGKGYVICEPAGYPDYNEDLSNPEAFDNAIGSMKEFCDWCYTLDDKMAVMLEIIPYGGNINSVETMMDFIEKVGAPNLYVNCDIGHFSLQRVNPARLEKCGDRLIHAHVSDDDNRGHQGQMREADFVIGEGNTDFPAYIKALQKFNADANAKKAGFEECHCMFETWALNKGVPDFDYVLEASINYMLRYMPGVFDSSISYID